MKQIGGTGGNDNEMLVLSIIIIVFLVVFFIWLFN